MLLSFLFFSQLPAGKSQHFVSFSDPGALSSFPFRFPPAHFIPSHPTICLVHLRSIIQSPCPYHFASMLQLIYFGAAGFCARWVGTPRKWLGFNFQTQEGSWWGGLLQMLERLCSLSADCPELLAPKSHPSMEQQPLHDQLVLKNRESFLGILHLLQVLAPAVPPAWAKLNTTIRANRAPGRIWEDRNGRVQSSKFTLPLLWAGKCFLASEWSPALALMTPSPTARFLGGRFRSK